MTDLRGLLSYSKTCGFNEVEWIRGCGQRSWPRNRCIKLSGVFPCCGLACSTVAFLRSSTISLKNGAKLRHTFGRSPGDSTYEKHALQNCATLVWSFRSQMLYPVELRAQNRILPSKIHANTAVSRCFTTEKFPSKIRCITRSIGDSPPRQSSAKRLAAVLL